MIDSKTFSEKVQESFGWLTELGYSFRQIDTNIYFEKVNQNEAYAIGFSWSEYNEILVNGFTAYKRFNNVEHILQEVIGGALDYTIKHHWQGKIPKELKKVKDQQYFANAFYIADISEVEIFSKAVKYFFEADAKSFFNKYSKLNNVINEMEKLPGDKKASMIVNSGNSIFMRIMAIKYFVEPKDGEKFYKETLKELSPLKSQRVFGDILQKMDNLKAKLI
ncbi:MAG: hypothetical protein JW783_05190 [Bacteroidales bacterium]|nr:hypothetical protein [Bacteroidales bacterium]MBN2749606.1 hypothetical protein [Bacteroidales bacterium]